MAGKNTIDSRIETIDGQLRRLGVDPEQGGDLAALSIKARVKADALLELRASLKDLEISTPQQQIERYGRERWAGEFIRLRELENHPATRFEGEKLRRLVWQHLPEGRFRRFQEIFCHEDDRIVPRFTLERRVESGAHRERVLFPGFYPNASVLPCLFSPDRIPEKLLEDLGIVSFRDLQRKPAERILRRVHPETLVAFKEVLDSAHPLERGEYRQLLIKAGPAAGAILITRQPADQEPAARGHPPEVRDLEAALFFSPSAAMRRVDHAQLGYRQQGQELQQIRARLQVSAEELKSWRNASPEERESMRARIQSFTGEAAERLSTAQGWFLRRAGELMAQVGDLRDSREQDNPSKAVLVMIRALEKLIVATGSTPAKTGFLARDQAVLGGELDRHRALLDDYADRIRSAAEKLRLPHYLFGSRIRPEAIEAQGGNLLRALQLDPDQTLGSLELLPYTAVREGVVRQYARLGTALRQADQGGARDAIVMLHTTLKLFSIWHALEDLKEALGQRRPMDEELRAVRATLGGRRPFPERRIATIDELRQELAEPLKTLRDLERAPEPIAVVDRFDRGGPYDLLAAIKRL